MENEALYRERVERAKSGKLDLDLSNLNLEKELPSGNHELKCTFEAHHDDSHC